MLEGELWGDEQWSFQLAMRIRMGAFAVLGLLDERADGVNVALAEWLGTANAVGRGS